MDIAGLEYFISVAENRSFTTASRQCAVTQTAISQHIKNMEKDLGFKLFDRDTRHVSLTAAGEVFYRDALKLVKEYENAVINGRNAAEGRIGRLVIAVPGYPEGELLAPRFRSYAKRYPMVQLSVQITPCEEMPILLQKREIDLAVFQPYDFDKREFDARFIGEYPMDLLCSPNGPLKDKTSAYIHELRGIKVSAIDFSSMPYTKSAMAKQWREVGMDMPDLRNYQGLRSIEEVVIAIKMDDELGVFVPSYERTFAFPNMHFVQIRDKLRLSLYAVIARENKKQELANFLPVLMDNRIPLVY